MLRFLYLIDLIIEHQDEFRLAMHRERAYWRWEELREELRLDKRLADDGMSPEKRLEIIKEAREKREKERDKNAG